MKLLFISRQ